MRMRFTSWLLALLAFCPVIPIPLAQNQAVDVENGYDPGICNQTNHGKLKLVKNREGKDLLVICAQEKGVYLWRTTDGSTSLGEFVSPGYDCSDILNKDMNAKDGFYWIHLNENFPKKVWCDMTTDGGGYMLFGYQNSSATWNVPSNNESVDPFGSPHWSSILGNTPILDIRIQVSSSREFQDTKIHWSFRLNKERPLKNLMIIGEKGCDDNSPGIGDIAYVKDLNTEKIVTTNFRCSKFGTAYHVGTKFGWANMNLCLQKPCQLGFAFLGDFPFQIDHHGAFSYSLNRPISGAAHKATSLIGCDKGMCCACYGPVGGTMDYCADRCTAINGGTVVKTAFAWYWVRSTLPKRVWSKCMEYQRQGDNGQQEWYKLILGDSTPVKGRCMRKEPLLNEGIVVVPDGNKFNNVPRVPGLISFRKDTNQLFLRSSSAWRTVTDERQFNPLRSRVSQLQRNFRTLDTSKSQHESRISKIEEAMERLSLIRLEGTGIRSKGRVEVYHPFYGWGTVCDDSWDINDGNVVCRQLGFTRATAAQGSAHCGEGTGPILLDDLECTGNEKHLWECTHRGWNVDNCSHGEDASVYCE